MPAGAVAAAATTMVLPSGANAIWELLPDILISFDYKIISEPSSCRRAKPSSRSNIPYKTIWLCNGTTFGLDEIKLIIPLVMDALTALSMIFTF
jgi:hypothetical protein